MTHYVIDTSNGLVTHRNVDIDNLNVSEDAEIFDNKEDFEDRLGEIIDTS